MRAAPERPISKGYRLGVPPRDLYGLVRGIDGDLRTMATGLPTEINKKYNYGPDAVLGSV